MDRFQVIVTLSLVVLLTRHGPAPSMVTCSEPIVNGQKLSYWISQLKSGDPKSFALILAAIEQFPAHPLVINAIPEVIRLHEKGNFVQRGHLIRVLRRVGEPAVETLRRNLVSEFFTDRIEALDLMGRIGPLAAVAIEDIRREMRNDNSQCRVAAAKSVCLICGFDAESLEFLCSVLINGHEAARINAAQSLNELGFAINKYKSLIAKALDDTCYEVRFHAIQSLLRLVPNEPNAIKALIAGMKSEIVLERLAMLHVVSLFGPRASLAFPSLVSLLEDNDEGVRFGAIQAVNCSRQVGNDVINKLRYCLKDPNPRIRAVAVEALGRVGADGKSVKEEVARMMDDSDVSVRISAAGSLMVLKHEVDRATEIFVECLTNSNHVDSCLHSLLANDVSVDVVRCSIQRLMTTGTEDQKDRVIEIVGRSVTRSQYAVNAVKSVLASNDWSAKAKVIETLIGQLSIPEGVTSGILECFDESDNHICRLACSVLERCDSNDRTRVAEFLRNRLNMSNDVIRLIVAETHWRLRQDKLAVTPVLLELSESQNELRFRASLTLTQIGETQRALRVFRTALKGHDRAVRRDALASLVNWSPQTQETMELLASNWTDATPGDQWEILDIVKSNPKCLMKMETAPK